jgi:hypothetical protein
MHTGTLLFRVLVSCMDEEEGGGALTRVHPPHPRPPAHIARYRCEIIIGEYEEEIESLLYKKDADIFNKVCRKDACKGVDMSDKTKGSKIEAFVDGKPMGTENEDL